MTSTKNKLRKGTILPILLAIGFISATSLLMDASAEFLPTVPVHEDAILPDISPGIPKHLNIQNDHQNEWLRFTNVWGNVGKAGLEFEPLFPDPDAEEGTTQDAYQNLYDEEGQFKYSKEPVWHQVVSEFEFHDIHNHWHIADIGEFSVRNAIPNDSMESGYEIGEIAGWILEDENGNPVLDENGDPVEIKSTAVKVGFCIADVYPFNGDNPATSLKWFWECEVGFQGIQPGWVDQYHQSVEDNEIEITGLDDGIYFLTHTWNPEERFVDANSDNDQSWLLFELSDENNGNGNRKITELAAFAPECDPDTTPGLCGNIKKNS